MEAIHANNDYEHSPLYLAVQNGSFRIVRLLIYGRAIEKYKNCPHSEDKVEHEAVRERGAIVKRLVDQEGKNLITCCM